MHNYLNKHCNEHFYTEVKILLSHVLYSGKQTIYSLIQYNILFYTIFKNFSGKISNIILAT